MWIVKYGNQYLHDPRVSVFITDTSLSVELNSSGEFSFSIAKNHPLYDVIREGDINNEITVYNDGNLIFCGMIVELNKNFQLTTEVVCRGEMSYLNDSRVSPFSTSAYESGETAPNSLTGFFNWLINNHNNQVDDNRKFVVGRNEGDSIAEGNFYLSDTSYSTTGSIIKNGILENYTAYVTIEHKDGYRYINLVKDFDPINAQIIDFGVNLLDFTDGNVSDDVATAVIPLGATMSETDYTYFDGYSLTEDTTPNSSKTYYCHDKYEQVTLRNVGTEDAPVYTFEDNTKYFEKVATYVYTYAPWDSCNPNVTYYYNNKLGSVNHLYYFDYGVQYYEQASDGSYFKTSDKTPNWDKTYYRYSYSSTSNLQHFSQWTDGDRNGYDYYTRKANEFFIASSDSSPVHGKTYYTSPSSVSYTECDTPLRSFDSTKSYFEYDAHADESNLKLTLEAPMYEATGDYKIYGNKIICISAAEKYGMITTVYENSDITTREELASYGLIYLKSAISPVRSLELKAVDLAMIKPDYDPIFIGQYVRARSKPHGLDSYFLCTAIDYDLNQPDNNTFTLGTTFDTLTGQQNSRINALNSTINHVYEKAERISEESKATAIIAADAKEAADKAVISTTDEYVLSSSTTEAPTEGWSEETPEWQDDQFYIWRRTKTVYGDGSIVYCNPAIMTGNSGKDGVDAALLRIDSSRGTVFKNNAVSTVLTVRIFYGEKIIETKSQLTEAFGSGAYLEWSWLRINDEAFGIISSTDSRISQNGFCLVISPDDVDVKTTFTCELKV